LRHRENDAREREWRQGDENKINMAINIMKAKYGFRDKSEVINRMVLKHGEILLEPTLRPEFVAKMRKRSKEKMVKVTDFAKRYGLK